MTIWETMREYAEKYQTYAQHMLDTHPKHWNMLATYQRHADKQRGRQHYKTCSKHVQRMLDTYQAYAQNMAYTCRTSIALDWKRRTH